MPQVQNKLEDLKAIVGAGLDHYKREGELDPNYIKIAVAPKLSEVVINYCRDIEEYHVLGGVEDRNKSLVIHYTSISALFSMFQNAANGKKASLRLYDSVHFNDPNEGHILVKYFEEKHDWLKLEQEHPSCAYVASFVKPRSDETSKNYVDKLLFWLTYGDQCKGCSLMLTIPNNRLRTVSYSAEEAARAGDALLPVLETVEPLAKINVDIRLLLAKNFFESLEGIRYLYKSQDHQFENECRFLTGASSVCSDDISYEISNKSPVIVRHYCEDEDLCIEEIFGSGSTITIGSHVPDFADLEKSLTTLIERINVRLEEEGKLRIMPTIRLSQTQYRTI